MVHDVNAGFEENDIDIIVFGKEDGKDEILVLLKSSSVIPKGTVDKDRIGLFEQFIKDIVDGKLGREEILLLFIFNIDKAVFDKSYNLERFPFCIDIVTIEFGIPPISVNTILL